MKTKTKISKQLGRKTSPELSETILLAKKNEAWLKIAAKLSGPRRNRENFNLREISSNSKEGENVVICGKVLSMGELDKKIKIIALNFSESAREKILKSGSKASSILEEIKNNPEAKGIKILGADKK